MTRSTRISAWTCVVVLSACFVNALEPPPCECVQYYQCEDHVIKTDGRGLILFKAANNRASVPKCGALEICCEYPKNDTGAAGTTSASKQPTSPLSVDGSSPRPCGLRQEQAQQSTIKSSGGNPDATNFAEFPWTMMLLVKKQEDGKATNKLKCGGSLVHPLVVVTAAYCLQGLKKEVLTVRGGEWDTKSEDEPLPHQDRSVKEIIIYPEYKQVNGHNDIAVLIVDSPFKITDNVATICLTRSNNFDYTKCITAGWGKDSIDERSFNQVLRKVESTVLPSEECQERFRKTVLGRFFILDESFVCTEGGGPGRDTCLGDGGSPLICPHEQFPTRWTQVGIVAWGIACGDNNPAVYTRVFKYVDWIYNQIPSTSADEDGI